MKPKSRTPVNIMRILFNLKRMKVRAVADHQ